MPPPIFYMVISLMARMANGKGDRYRPVPKDYGEKFDRIFRPTRWERLKKLLRKIAFYDKLRKLY